MRRRKKYNINNMKKELKIYENLTRTQWNEIMHRTSDCFIHDSVLGMPWLHTEHCALLPNCLILFFLFSFCLSVLFAMVYFHLIVRAFFFHLKFLFLLFGLNWIFIAMLGLEFYMFHSLINLFIFITMLKFTKRISLHS